MSETIVVPGQRIGLAKFVHFFLCIFRCYFVYKLRDYECGSGTYISGDYIFATIAGTLKESPAPSGFGKKTVSVANKRPPVAVPKIGSIVICRITRISQRDAQAKILAVDTTILPEPFPGIIRKQDVRQTQTDLLEMNNCFRPGDVVRARVV